MQGISINTLDVHKIIAKLSNKNTIGPDNISPQFIKNLASSISLPLALMFQKSINDGNLLSIWKVAHVISLFKEKGSKYDVTNYRPISLCATLSTILESITNERLSEHFNNNNLLSNAQHDFMPRKSTVSHLIELTHGLINDLNNENCIDLICTDFSKAFDTVSHEKLLYKLNKYSIYQEICIIG